MSIISQEEFSNRIHSIFPKANFTILKYNGVRGPIVIKCERCGLIREIQTAYNILQKQKFCPRCDGKRVSEFIELCNAHQVKIIEYGKSIKDNSTLQCLKCGNIWEKSISNATNKKQVNCPFCSSKSPAHKYINYLARIEERYGKNQYEILAKDFVGTDKIPVRHKCGFIFKTRINDFLKSQGCPRCAPRLSKGEKAVIEFLEKNKITYEFQASIPETHQRFDFLIDNIYAIEYQGEQHFRDTFGDTKTFQQTLINDEKKRKYCKENNIDLLEISYKDFSKIDMILTNFLAQRLSLTGVEKN